MDIAISLSRGTSEDLEALREWLAAEDRLRGRVTFASRPTGADKMGPAIDALTVAVGSGGALTVLASSIPLFLRSLRSDVHIVLTDEAGIKRVEVDATNVSSAGKLIIDTLHESSTHEH